MAATAATAAHSRCLAFAQMRARSFAIVITVLAVIGLLGYGLLSKGGDSIAVGDQAPDKRLQRLDGSGTGEIGLVMTFVPMPLFAR